MTLPELGPPAPTGYKIEITYANGTHEEITVSVKGVFTWTTMPYPAAADWKSKKILALLRICQYLMENGGVKVEIKELVTP